MSIGTQVQILWLFIDFSVLAVWAVTTELTAAMADKGGLKKIFFQNYLLKWICREVKKIQEVWFSE